MRIHKCYISLKLWWKSKTNKRNKQEIIEATNIETLIKVSNDNIFGNCVFNVKRYYAFNITEATNKTNAYIINSRLLIAHTFYPIRNTPIAHNKQPNLEPKDLTLTKKSCNQSHISNQTILAILKINSKNTDYLSNRIIYIYKSHTSFSSITFRVCRSH